MNKSQRISIDVNAITDNYVNFKLEQDIDFLELLSLKIDQKDIYQSFNADYGVLVGRVLANGSVGIPNAKVSIFIPIDDDDKNDSEIYAAYPYENPRDKNRDGKRYNLLPRVGKEEITSGAIKPKQPFGSFPTKEEFVTNETWVEVYKKYYKYSTITNTAGDYMLFGVPVGTQTVHMSVDITDIGKYSMSPIDMVTQLGYSPNLFTSTGEIKPQKNLEDLPHIETQEISVDVIPFWGDKENFEIGITRQDFRIRAVLVSNFVIFGSYFTMGRLSVNGDPDRSRANNNGYDDGFYLLSETYANNVDFRTNRIGELDIKVFSYQQSIDMDVVDNDIATSGTTIDPQKDIFLLDPASYFTYAIDGEFIVSVPCNRKKIITDEFGNETPVSNDNVNGVFTEFYGMTIVEHEDIPIEKTYENEWRRPNSANNARLRFKIPQDYFSIRDEQNNQTTLADYSHNNEYPAANGWARLAVDQRTESEIWRKKYFTFKAQEFYTVSQFFPTKFNDDDVKYDPDRNAQSRVNYLSGNTGEGFSHLTGAFKVGGEVQTTQEDLDNFNVISGGSSGGTITGSSFVYDFPHNATVIGSSDLYFGAQWMNMTMYFPQINWTFDFIEANNNRDQNTSDMWWKDYFTGRHGDRGEWFSTGKARFQNLIGGEIGTNFLASAHGLRTTFVQVPKDDIVLFSNIDRKGLRKNDENLSGVTLSGTYEYLPATGTSAQFNYGEVGFDYTNQATPTVPNPFFFRGMYNADCIQLLFDLNFI